MTGCQRPFDVCNRTDFRVAASLALRLSSQLQAVHTSGALSTQRYSAQLASDSKSIEQNFYFWLTEDITNMFLN